MSPPALRAVFLQLRTPSDLLTVYDLLEQGVHVGFEPVTGSIFGPHTPSEIIFEPVKEVGYRAVSRRKGFNHGLHLDIRASSLREYLDVMLHMRRPYRKTYVECDPALESVIREIHLDILNMAAELPIPKIYTTKLVQVIARHFGATCEAQLSYGDSEWGCFGRMRLGKLVYWCKPPLSDLRDMLTARVPGLINAVRGVQTRPWFAGLSDGFLLPDKGVIRHIATDDPAERHAATDAPTGLGPEWDQVNSWYRLLGVRGDANDNLNFRHRNKPIARARSHCTKNFLAKPRDRVTVVADGSVWDYGNPSDASLLRLKISDPEDTANWLDLNWNGLLGVELIYPEDSDQSGNSGNDVQIAHRDLINDDSGREQGDEGLQNPSE